MPSRQTAVPVLANSLRTYVNAHGVYTIQGKRERLQACIPHTAEPWERRIYKGLPLEFPRQRWPLT